MQLDRKSLNRLLSLNDRQLQAIIEKLATEYGLDLSRFQVRPGDMDSLRNAIKNASDSDLLELSKQIQNGR
jgi:coproporphyrinogen III oxidase-like Fe-S oxidoreductase